MCVHIYRLQSGFGNRGNLKPCSPVLDVGGTREENTPTKHRFQNVKQQALRFESVFVQDKQVLHPETREPLFQRVSHMWPIHEETAGYEPKTVYRTGQIQQQQRTVRAV
jgi:hypothetical protein